jgi:hypothetical protein
MLEKIMEESSAASSIAGIVLGIIGFDLLYCSCSFFSELFNIKTICCFFQEHENFRHKMQKYML